MPKSNMSKEKKEKIKKKMFEQGVIEYNEEIKKNRKKIKIDSGKAIFDSLIHNINLNMVDFEKHIEKYYEEEVMDNPGFYNFLDCCNAYTWKIKPTNYQIKKLYTNIMLERDTEYHLYIMFNDRVTTGEKILSIDDKIDIHFGDTGIARDVRDGIQRLLMQSVGIRRGY